jgi:hypothetical protein
MSDHIKSPVELQIDQLAACNVGGRIRAAIEALQYPNLLKGIDILEELLCFIEQHDMPGRLTKARRIEILKEVQQNCEWPDGVTSEEIEELVGVGFAYEDDACPGIVVLTSLGEMEIGE